MPKRTPDGQREKNQEGGALNECDGKTHHPATIRTTRKSGRFLLSEILRAGIPPENRKSTKTG